MFTGCQINGFLKHLPLYQAATHSFWSAKKVRRGISKSVHICHCSIHKLDTHCSNVLHS